MQEFEVRVAPDGTVGHFTPNTNVFHRPDGGPAVTEPDGSKYWFVHGLLHRLDGPAIDHASGYKIWCRAGKIHREDGPAAMWSTNDTVEYWLDDVQYDTKALYEKALEKL